MTALDRLLAALGRAYAASAPYAYGHPADSFEFFEIVNVYRREAPLHVQEFIEFIAAREPESTADVTAAEDAACDAYRARIRADFAEEIEAIKARARGMR